VTLRLASSLSLLSLLSLLACRRTPQPEAPPAAPVAARDASALADTSAPPDASASPASSSAEPVARFDASRCVIAPARGVELSPWTESLSVAATGGRALVLANTLRRFDQRVCRRDPEACMGDYAGHEYAPATQGWIAGDSLPESLSRFTPAHIEFDPQCGAAGCVAHEDFGVAFAQGDARRVFTASYGYSMTTARVAFSDERGRELSRQALFGAMRDGDERFLPTELPRDRVAAAANARVRLGALVRMFSPSPADGPQIDTSLASMCGARVGLALFVDDGRSIRAHEIEPFVVPAQCTSREVLPRLPDALAMAMREDRGALVFRRGASLFLQRLDGQGAPVRTPEAIFTAPGRERPGAPSIAYDGDSLSIVFALRGSGRAPYVLQSLRFDPTLEPAGTPVPLPTGAASAFAPALAVRDGAHVLGWMEGNDRAGSIRVAISAISLEDAVAHALTVASDPLVNARDPEVSFSDGRGWIAWTERPARADGGPVNAMARLAALRCTTAR
jgi:hypothetical protein